MGLLLIAAPWLFDFAEGGAETWIPVVLGVAMIGLALMTDYEMGVARTISMRTHLMIDLVSGIFLAVSPWLFGFADYVYEPHLILGILEIGAALTTRRDPVRGADTRHNPLTSH